MELRMTAGRELVRRLTSSETTPAPPDHPEHDLRWLCVLSRAMRQEPILLEAFRGGRRVGQLPLALVTSWVFGRFLVSLPYLNSAGVQAADQDVAGRLIDWAVEITDQRDCRFLELRHEEAICHPRLNSAMSSKVHMRLALPGSIETLWGGLSSKVRNQVRKGQKLGLRVRWGGEDVLGDFYRVFSRNMRDLGTPVYGRGLFRLILQQFPREAELCVVSQGTTAVAGALLVHGRVVTEVPSASSLREYNSTNANMLMYWHLLERSVQRGQQVFDFGRSTVDGNTYRFKKQWGAEPSPAIWQYYLRKGDVDQLRPSNSRNQRLIAIWQRLPVTLTRLIGPRIDRGIP
jgi:FemAB-related protein (PEP-CTERM system-associated)